MKDLSHLLRKKPKQIIALLTQTQFKTLPGDKMISLRVTVAAVVLLAVIIHAMPSQNEDEEEEAPVLMEAKESIENTEAVLERLRKYVNDGLEDEDMETREPIPRRRCNNSKCRGRRRCQKTCRG